MEEDPKQRGPNFRLAEDLQICNAWIGTSEDATVGTNMRTSDFKDKFHARYVLLITRHNNEMGSDYSNRNATGCYNRFKKISRGVLKYIGTENSVGSPPSGDTDKEKWNEKVQEMFLKRHPDFVKIVDTIQAAKEILGDKPKWRAFQDEEESSEGAKKAKEKKADREVFVREIL